MLLRRSVSLASLSCLLVLTAPRAEAVTPAHTDVEVVNVTAAVARAAEIELWLDTILWNDTVRWNAAVKTATAARRASARADGGTARPATRAVVAPSGRCGGALPPCWIMMRESRGLVHIHDGKWQIIPSTWQNFGGYANAGDAPEAVQDAKAASMAACNWTPPNYCAG